MKILGFRDLEDILIFIILVLFLLISPFYLSYNVWWDSAVYINMGKYIFSLGNVGLWEASRPLIWPSILGFIWKIGLSPIILGSVLELFFSTGCIFLTYLIGKEVFSKKTGLLAALLLAFTPTFFFFSSKLLTGIPSTFFGLIALLFFIRKKYFLSGLFSGIAFMTRFLQLGIFISFLLLLFICFRKRKKFLKPVKKMLYGFSIIFLPYLIINFFLYTNPLLPFKLQFILTRYTGWMYYEPFLYYFVNLFKDNFLVIFSIVGLIIIFKKMDYKNASVLTLFLLFFFFFSLIKHKEMRFALTFYPYLYLTSSYGLFYILSKIKLKKLSYPIVLILLCLLLIQAFPQHKVEEFNYNFVPFYNYVAREDVKDGIWITNPVFIVYSDKKADELIYDNFNSENARKQQQKLNKAKHILVNSCDFPCPPIDKDCDKEKQKLLELMKDNFNVIYYNTFWDCEHYIFRK